MSLTTQQHTLASLVHTNPQFSDFVHKLEQLSQINHVIANKLAPELHAHCQVANLRDGILILSTTSPTWNHKLRFGSADLLSALRREPRWAGLKGIEIRVDYLPQKDNNTTPSSKKPKSISKKAAGVIAETAQNINNQKLAAALIKLAKL